MRIAVKFAYDGRKFFGYARQPKLKTAEGELIKILQEYSFIEDIKQSQFRSASRTDKGVSALGNVIAFNTESSKELAFQKLCGKSKDIIFYGIKEAESDFFPRYAKLRIYRYYLKKQNITLDRILPIAELFTGKHNFGNFARVEEFKDPIRAIDNIVISGNNEFFIIDFYAQTFLWHQIRRIISALEKVGSGKLEKEHIIKALNNPDKKVDFGIAAAEPLILKDIVYDFEFEYNKNMLEKTFFLEERIVSEL